MKHVVVFVALLAGLSQCSAAQAQSGALTVFANVDVVDVEQGVIDEDRTVFVDGGVILAIVDAAAIIPEDASIIQGQGLFLAPGLADMHTHTWYEDIQLPLDLAFGVTTIREMWGSQSTIDARSQITTGAMLGPRIVMAGPIVDGDPPVWPGSTTLTDPALAAQVVAIQRAEGYDFIKPYNNLSPEVFAALAQAAHDAGMPIAGHVPRSVSLAGAITAGMASIEHMGATFEKEALREGIDPAIAGYRAARWELGARVASGELSLGEVYDWDKLRDLARQLAEAGIAITPTLTVDARFMQTSAERERRLAQDYTQFASSDMRAMWLDDEFTAEMGWNDERIEAMRALAEADRTFMRIFLDEGVMILAGTDTPNPFMVHGLSLHEELAGLRDAGMGNLGAIRAATIYPARFMGEQGQWGEVREGARADLVLLAANPLEDVANYLSIEGVMAAGRWLGPQAIADMRQEGLAAYAAIPADPPPAGTATSQ